MQKRQVLLLTDVYPCSHYSGALVSAQLCHFLLDAGYSVHCACIHSASITTPIDQSLQQIPTLDFIKPPENYLPQDQYEAKLTPIKDQIVAYIRNNHIDTIWCPLQGETLLKILNSLLSEFKDLRLITQIWDPFEWYLHDMKYHLETQAALLEIFDKVIRKSTCVLTASRPMSKFYHQKYHIPSFPIFASYDLPTVVPDKSQRQDFTIVISGQTYAKSGINSLLQALEKLNWKYKNHTIKIKYFGSKPNIFKKYKQHVTIGDYIPQPELIKEQSAADLLYCSYFFDDPALRIVSEQSYPSKIITYIPSHTPILIHAAPTAPIYQDFQEYRCGFLLDSTNENLVIKKLKEIIDTPTATTSELVSNSLKLFKHYFTPAQNSKTLLKAFATADDIFTHPRVLEINNIDLPGHPWNGYDLMNYLNRDTNCLVHQICTYKLSHNDDVVKLYNSQKQLDLEYNLINFETNTLSVHSCLSASTPALLNSSVYHQADLLHFHLIHNMKLSLFSLIEMCNSKPAIISVHDPWTFTGHCVHFGDCTKYLTGCHDCPYLDIMFPLKFDTSHELWQLKKLVYENIDVDFVVSSQYMYDLFKSSPLTKNKRIHLIPFGIDINKYSGVTNPQARQHYRIPKDHIVLFHRAQKEFKGTNFFVDALKQLQTDRKITVITCGEKGLLDSIKPNYNIVELGQINDDELIYAYNACDMLIMPSIGESFGMMSVEAMSCGKPVVCFDNTALPSVTHAPDCGIAVENLNSTKLMEAIQHLIDDEKDRLRRGALAKKLVKEVYNVDVYNQKTKNLYDEVLHRKHQFDKIILEKSVHQTPSVITLQNQLNHLTKSLFPRRSSQYKNLHYSTKLSSHFHHATIEYGSLDVQLLLDQYNHDLFAGANQDIKPSLYHRFVRRPAHFAKLFISLLKNDRKTLAEVTKKRLHLR